MWIALTQQCDAHGSCLSYIMKTSSCLWSPCEVLANFISVKKQLTDIERYISGLLSPEKYIRGRRLFLGVFIRHYESEDKTNQPDWVQNTNLDFREFETLSSKNLGNSEFWGSFFSVLRCGVFTVAIKNYQSSVVYVYNSLWARICAFRLHLLPSFSYSGDFPEVPQACVFIGDSHKVTADL